MEREGHTRGETGHCIPSPFLQTTIATRGQPTLFWFRASDEAKEFLATEGYDKEFGARPLRRSIQRLLEDPLSEELLQGKYKAGSTIIISLNKVLKKF